MANKGMRVKEMGATINLGNYSSLHVTIGEESEFSGLDIAKGQKYLKAIAESVNGMLNLPDHPEKKVKTKAPVVEKPTIMGERLFGFNGSGEIYYDHKNHAYTSAEGTRYCSVTQMLSEFYPFSGDIAKEYMDFAAAYGNLIHTAIQNAVIGKAPKKKLVKEITDEALKAMGKFERGVVEQPIIYPEHEVAGRFDILTFAEKNTLWDVKTNSDLYASATCTLPEPLKQEFGKYWKVDSIYGEHCLQLNLYAYIIEHTTDVVVDNINIIHVPDGFKEIVHVPKVDVSAIFQAYGAIR